MRKDLPVELIATCRLLGIDCAIVNGGFWLGYLDNDPRSREGGHLSTSYPSHALYAAMLLSDWSGAPVTWQLVWRTWHLARLRLATVDHVDPRQ